MEIMAAIVGLESLKTPCSVTLYSDSKYIVDAMTKGWVQRWKTRNWWRNKEEKAKNVDLWERLLAVSEQHTATFIWVKGHSGNQDNEHCDKLAGEAAIRDNLSVDQGYEQ